MTGHPGRPEPRTPRGIRLVSVTPDPAAHRAFPPAVTCPQCHGVMDWPERGSDDELALFWDHLRTHTTHPLVLIQFWATALSRAGEEPS